MTQVEGSLLGISLTALVAATGSWLGVTWSLGVLDLVVPALVIGGVVGWVSAVRAVETSSPWRVAIGAALRAVVYGTVLVALASAVIAFLETRRGVDLGSLVWLPFIVVYGLVFAFPITLPIALVSVATLRVGESQSHAPAFVVASAVALSGALWLAGSADLGSETNGSSLDGPVALEWTVANRSTEQLVLFVGDPDEGGLSWGGWTQDLPGCFYSTGKTREAVDWYLALGTPDEAYDDQDGDFPPPPGGSIVSAEDVPGPRAAVWIDVAPDGTRTILPNRGAPTLDEQTLDLCEDTRP